MELTKEYIKALKESSSITFSVDKTVKPGVGHGSIFCMKKQEGPYTGDMHFTLENIMAWMSDALDRNKKPMVAHWSVYTHYPVVQTFLSHLRPKDNIYIHIQSNFNNYRSSFENGINVEVLMLELVRYTKSGKKARQHRYILDQNVWTAGGDELPHIVEWQTITNSIAAE